MFVALCMAGAMAGLSSCKTAQSAASSIEALEGEWKITTVEGQSVTPKAGEAEAFLGFDVKENLQAHCRPTPRRARFRSDRQALRG